MPSTLKYGITYPSGSVAPNVPVVMQTQAESVEAAIDAVADSPLVQVALNTTNQTLTTGAKTAVSWNYRTGTAGMNGTVNPTRLTCTKSGLYQVNSTLLYTNVSGGFRSLSIRKNGLSSDIEVMNNPNPSGNYNNAMTGMTYIRLVTNDYIEIMAEVLGPASTVALVAGAATNDTTRFAATRATMEYIRP